ncbi:hypothetical protein JXA34_01550 [Patescibacteria group bacterium]|nr:hypothetical protein [Patescibacteria group bacterium]
MYLGSGTYGCDVENLFVEYHLYYFVYDDAKEGFARGDGEFGADPLFVDLGNENFHLQPNSPTIDKGINLGYSSDFDGNYAPNGSFPDLGAYEYFSGVSPTPASISETENCKVLMIYLNLDFRKTSTN